MSKTTPINNILIIGDWFVNEYWFMARHNSETSSHTNSDHFRIVSAPAEAVKDLSGAGLVARVLYELRQYSFNPNPVAPELFIHQPDIVTITDILQNTMDQSLIHGSQADEYNFGVGFHNNVNNIRKNYNLYGVGIWGPDDTDILKHFIHAKSTEESGKAIRASFSLTPQKCPYTSDIELLRLDTAPVAATIRIIRAYQLHDSHFNLVNRIDWEQRPPIETAPNDDVNKWYDQYLSFLDDRTLSIILNDHMKGFTQSGLVELLAHKKPHARWYVRTKNKDILSKTARPHWFDALNEIELLAVGPDIASRKYPMERILTKADRLTRHSYELIKDFVEPPNHLTPKIKNVLIASDQLEAIIFLEDLLRIVKTPEGYKDKSEPHLIALASSAKDKDIHLQKIDWTTALFASLTHKLVEPPIVRDLVARGDSTALKKAVSDAALSAINEAVSNAHTHSGVTIPESVFYRPKLRSSDKSSVRASNNRLFLVGYDACLDGEWAKISERWKASMGVTKSKLGIVDIDEGDGTNKTQLLQIWRASTDLPGYIACINEKRKAIGRIWQEMRNFTSGRGAARPLSILLDADPGVGKTFLAEQLARALECHLIHRDVTQMIHRDELLDLFNSVATAQAEQKNTVFVFVDEINASLDGSPVYGAFLSPLESGDYMQQGTKIKLKPLIWMFAGSHVLPRQVITNGALAHSQAEKLEDFRSRLNMIEMINYDAMKERAMTKTKAERFDQEARLEQVYLGAQMVNNFFNDVSEIHEDMLEIFYALDPAKAPARKIRNLARFLQNVQYGRVSNINCTHGYWAEVFLNDFCRSTTDWRRWVVKKIDPARFVKLDFRKET